MAEAEAEEWMAAGDAAAAAREAEEAMEGEANESEADEDEEEGTSLCDLCKTERPLSATDISPQINGWVCIDSDACHARCAPAPRARRVTDFAAFHSGRR